LGAEKQESAEMGEGFAGQRAPATLADQLW